MKSNVVKLETINRNCDDLKVQSHIVSSIERFSSSSASLTEILEKEKWQFSYCRGSYLGALKCLMDTLPPRVAKRQQIDGVPIDIFIKLKVDENVLDVLERDYPSGIMTGYFAKGIVKCAKDPVNPEHIYIKLLNVICGYKYGGTFRENFFTELFPKGTGYFVKGFAESYHKTFKELCDSNNKYLDNTTPVEDLLKNWPYWFTRTTSAYRLDGTYINQKMEESLSINLGLYEMFQERPEADFDGLSIDVPTDMF